MPKSLIQGLDTVPREIAKAFGPLFEEYLPGWFGNGACNFLRIGEEAEIALAPGDHLLIPAGQAHRVAWTAKDRPTVWLALHLG